MLLFNTFNNLPFPTEVKIKILRYINVFVRKDFRIQLPLIYWATLKNLPSVVKILLEFRIRFDYEFYNNINVATERYSYYGFQSIIHGCVEKRNIQILRLIMQYNKDVLSICNDVGDVFQTVISCGNLKAFKLFINESKKNTSDITFDLDYVNEPNCLAFGANSILHLICYTKKRRFLTFFFKFYQIPKELYFGLNNDDEMIPLQLAIHLKNYVVAEYILKHGPKLSEYYRKHEYYLDKFRKPLQHY